MRTVLRKMAAVFLALALTLTMLPLGASEVKAASPKLNYKSYNLAVKEKVTLKVSGSTKTPVWSSSNSAVASVSKGVVTGRKIGTATITAKIGSVKLTCKVNVKTDYKKLYKKQMEALSGNPYTKWYYVLDLDRDGMPELITGSRGYGRTGYGIYTVKKGKLVEVNVSCSNNEPSPTVRYNPAYHAIYIQGTVNQLGAAVYSLYRFSGHTLSQYKTARYISGGGSGAYATGKNIDSLKSVSKSSYNSFVKKYLTDYKTYPMLENTPANRKKSFG